MIKIRRILNNRRGLTLVELLITILLMGFVFSLVATMFIQASDVFFSSTRRMSAGQKAELIQTEVAGYLRALIDFENGESEDSEFPDDNNTWTFRGFHPKSNDNVEIKLIWNDVNYQLEIKYNDEYESNDDFKEDLVFTGVKDFNIEKVENENIFKLKVVVIDEEGESSRYLDVQSRNYRN